MTDVWPLCVLFPNCTIGGATIGSGSTILPGITIGKKAIIGAGSVVTKDIPSGVIWFGNPARFIRKVNEK